MELLCQRSGSTKAFKGKGELARLARQAGACLEEIVGEMRQLSQSSKRASCGGFHYLSLHRRPGGTGESCCLRWRSARHRHVRWAEVARDLKRLPIGLHDAYREMNRRAGELNALFRLCREERATLAKLARDRTEPDAPDTRCGGAGQDKATHHVKERQA